MGFPSTAMSGRPRKCATAQPQLSTSIGRPKVSTASAPDACRTCECKGVNKQQSHVYVGHCAHAGDGRMLIHAV
jgi:hypothetical protein